MRHIKFNKHICLAVLAFVMVAGISAEQAMAYFTTYDTAAGSVTVNLEFTETIPNDDVENNVKTISVKNDEYDPCFVRIKVFVGNKFAPYITSNEMEGEGWTQSGTYYEYDKILEPGETTKGFTIDLTRAFEVTPGNKDPQEFNVIVIQECAPVIYDKITGEAKADWAGNDYIIYEE